VRSCCKIPNDSIYLPTYIYCMCKRIRLNKNIFEVHNTLAWTMCLILRPFTEDWLEPIFMQSLFYWCVSVRRKIEVSMERLWFYILRRNVRTPGRYLRHLCRFVKRPIEHRKGVVTWEGILYDVLHVLCLCVCIL